MAFDINVLSDWNDRITRITQISSDDKPTVADLFELHPFDNQLSVYLRDGVEQENVTGNFTSDMILCMQSSLCRLGPEATARVSLPGHISMCRTASPEFAPPYRCVGHDPSSNLDTLDHQLNDVRLLELRGLKAPDAMSVLGRLVELPPSPSLTTMVIRDISSLSDGLPRGVSSALAQHKMICVAFERCSQLDPKSSMIRKVIATNRQEWREQMETNDEPAHKFGVELDEVKKRKGSSYFTYLHDTIQLADNSRIFVMIYTPRAGRITPILSLRNYKQQKLTFAAELRLAQRVDIPATRIERRVALSPSFEEVRLDSFQVDEPGHYELEISIIKGTQYIFKDLRVEFPVTPIGPL